MKSRWSVCVFVLLLGCSGESGTVNGSACVDFVCPCTAEGVRAAIAEADGPFRFDCDGPTTITIDEPINIEKHLILDGGGLLTLEGSGPESGLSTESYLGLYGLTLSRMQVTSLSGALEVDDSRVDGGEGYGIFNLSGPLSVIDTVVSGNGGPGIIHAGEERAEIRNSTITGNASDGISMVYDEAKAAKGCGVMTIENTTVSKNGSAGRYCGEVTVSNSTFSGNSRGILVDGGYRCEPIFKVAHSTVVGGVHYERSCREGFPGIILAKGTLIVGGCSNEPEGEAEWVSLGYNVEEDDDTCGFDHDTDQANVSGDQLKLGELADNGGLTQTHALGEGSLAIDRIPGDECPLETDQRDLPRDSSCDVGAFEVQP